MWVGLLLSSPCLGHNTQLLLNDFLPVKVKHWPYSKIHSGVKQPANGLLGVEKLNWKDFGVKGWDIFSVSSGMTLWMRNSFPAHFINVRRENKRISGWKCGRFSEWREIYYLSFLSPLHRADAEYCGFTLAAMRAESLGISWGLTGSWESWWPKANWESIDPSLPLIPWEMPCASTVICCCDLYPFPSTLRRGKKKNLEQGWSRCCSCQRWIFLSLGNSSPGQELKVPSSIWRMRFPGNFHAVFWFLGHTIHVCQFTTCTT